MGMNLLEGEACSVLAGCGAGWMRSVCMWRRLPGQRNEAVSRFYHIFVFYPLQQERESANVSEALLGLDFPPPMCLASQLALEELVEPLKPSLGFVWIISAAGGSGWKALAAVCQRSAPNCEAAVCLNGCIFSPPSSDSHHSLHRTGGLEQRSLYFYVSPACFSGWLSSLATNRYEETLLMEGSCLSAHTCTCEPSVPPGVLPSTSLFSWGFTFSQTPRSALWLWCD